MSAQQPTPEFQDYQLAFTRHIRDPKQHPRPAGVAARRMKVYNELLFNNVFNLISSCFPVARNILGKRKWQQLVREFFATHRCRSPYFRQLPEEFLQYMQERDSDGREPDFLIYLLHYEWVELAVDVSTKEVDLDAIDPAGELGTGRPVLAPSHMLLSYPYAVHRIGKRYQPTPEQQEQTYLLVFRDSNDKVRFVVLNPVSARLLALIEPGSLTGDEALAQVVEELQHPDPAVALAGGRAMLEELLRQGAILGTH
ncbi:MAG: putative DNA-binding domain-containing protein [Betaproteobacteria bacterium]|nr:MAG: putative DNA-binding domain-containing protein [Betaproteobacteria bacterium]